MIAQVPPTSNARTTTSLGTSWPNRNAAFNRTLSESKKPFQRLRKWPSAGKTMIAECKKCGTLFVPNLGECPKCGNEGSYVRNARPGETPVEPDPNQQAENRRRRAEEQKRRDEEYERRAEEERRRQEENAQRLAAEKKQEILAQRKSKSQCVMCGKSLGVFSRLIGRDRHPKCLVFQEG